MIGDRSVLAVITARGGSKGLPRKNLLPFRGAPLIAWTIRAAQAANSIDRLILSSDDPEIIETAHSLGCEAPFRRTPDLSSDTAASVDVLLDAAARVPGYDIVVLLQPTSPLRTAGSDLPRPSTRRGPGLMADRGIGVPARWRLGGVGLTGRWPRGQLSARGWLRSRGAV